MTEYIIPFVIFVLTLTAILGGGWHMSRQKKTRMLLTKIANDRVAVAPREGRLATERIRKVILNAAVRLGKLVKPGREAEVSHLRKKLLRAGLSDKNRNTMILFCGAKALSAATMPVCFAILKFSLMQFMLPLHFLGILAILGLIGFYLPDFWLAVKTAIRRDTIVRGFPDALDLMVICAEAGLGLDAAIARVGEESRLTNPPLSEELRLLNLEMRAGKSRRDALKALAMRTGVEDIESFATLLIQTEKFGTSVARALRVQADTMRVRRSQKVEELAAKLPVKLIFPTTLFIFPSMFLVLGGPALIQAFRAWTR